MSTMAITAADVNKLRQITGAGMMDCKNALTEANGDIDKAMEIIRKKTIFVFNNQLPNCLNNQYIICVENRTVIVKDHNLGSNY